MVPLPLPDHYQVITDTRNQNPHGSYQHHHLPMTDLIHAPIYMKTKADHHTSSKFIIIETIQLVELVQQCSITPKLLLLLLQIHSSKDNSRQDLLHWQCQSSTNLPEATTNTNLLLPLRIKVKLTYKYRDIHMKGKDKTSIHPFLFHKSYSEDSRNQNLKTFKIYRSESQMHHNQHKNMRV